MQYHIDMTTHGTSFGKPVGSPGGTSFLFLILKIFIREKEYIFQWSVLLLLLQLFINKDKFVKQFHCVVFHINTMFYFQLIFQFTEVIKKAYIIIMI